MLEGLIFFKVQGKTKSQKKSKRKITGGFKLSFSHLVKFVNFP